MLQTQENATSLKDEVLNSVILSNIDSYITENNYPVLLSYIDKWEIKGQSYLTVSHAYLGALAYHLYQQGFWRKDFGSWKEFCTHALHRPYPTITAAYNNYRYYIIEKQLTLEEYLDTLSKIGIVSCSRLKAKKFNIENKQTLLDMVEKLKSHEVNIQDLEKKEENYSFISFRIEKEKWEKIESFLETIENRIEKSPKRSHHIGERLSNVIHYCWGLL